LLIQGFEGWRSHAYPDPATQGKPYTIGYGHTGKMVYLGMAITRYQGDIYFNMDSKKFEVYVDRNLPFSINSKLFDMAVSGTYNFGYRIKGNLKACFWRPDKNYRPLHSCWMSYNHANGKVNRGLTNRRLRELNYAGI
jgi:GH24 family phage-related lysozyme (muramidase)